jgi:hypothetical protein
MSTLKPPLTGQVASTNQNVDDMPTENPLFEDAIDFEDSEEQGKVSHPPSSAPSAFASPSLQVIDPAGVKYPIQSSSHIQQASCSLFVACIQPQPLFGAKVSILPQADAITVVSRRTPYTVPPTSVLTMSTLQLPVWISKGPCLKAVEALSLPHWTIEEVSSLI